MSTVETCIALASEAGIKLAVAESCTGGLLGAALTSIPGSSSVFQGGLITYSNAAKTHLLGVDAGLIRRLGAVSADVAASMANGARRALEADVAISVTGIAGPGGGSREKPVGTVFMGVATRDATDAYHHHFKDMDRAAVRAASIEAALGHLRDVLETKPNDIG